MNNKREIHELIATGFFFAVGSVLAHWLVKQAGEAQGGAGATEPDEYPVDFEGGGEEGVLDEPYQQAAIDEALAKEFE